MAKFYPLKIKNIKRETKDAVSITFDIPTNLEEEFKFIAGQYITLKTTINGNEVRRAYSICSSPKSGEITVAVKQVKGGTFSVYATTELQQDAIIEVAPPEGKFSLKTDNSHAKNYLAFAAGSGITPIMAMIKDALEVEEESTFTLVFGNKSTYETIFFDEINDLKKVNSSRFFVQYVFSKEQPEGSLFGRIDQSTVNFVLKQRNVNFNDVFLCGPEQMILTVKDTFIEKGLDEDHIHFELFTASTKNESNNEEQENTNLDGETEITVLLDDESTTFSMKQADNILSASLKEDLDAPYSCQGGICSSCLAKVTEGKALMKNNSILSDDEVAQGYILTCAAHPTTSKITIDYDDI